MDPHSRHHVIPHDKVVHGLSQVAESVECLYVETTLLRPKAAWNGPREFTGAISKSNLCIASYDRITDAGF